MRMTVNIAEEIFQKIKEIIHPDYLNNDNPIILTESKLKNSPKVKLVKNNAKILVMNSDKEEARKFPYFTDIADLKKMNDCIIFCLHNCQLYVFLIELKSRNTNEVKKQLDAGKVFANFIIATSERMTKKTLKHKAKFGGLIFNTPKTSSCEVCSLLLFNFRVVIY